MATLLEGYYKAINDEGNHEKPYVVCNFLDPDVRETEGKFFTDDDATQLNVDDAHDLDTILKLTMASGRNVAMAPGGLHKFFKDEAQIVFPEFGTDWGELVGFPKKHMVTPAEKRAGLKVEAGSTDQSFIPLNER